jgi:hypothetical protein
MNNAATAKAERHPWRSVGAVLAGLIFIVVTHLGTDVVMHATGVFPPWFQPMADPLWVLALTYRAVLSVAGAYLTARLAPVRPLAHAFVLGCIGLVLSIMGVAANWNAGPEFGPKWFGIALAVIAIPCAWIGGKLRELQLRAQSQFAG